jgi:hypothetical protein
LPIGDSVFFSLHLEWIFPDFLIGLPWNISQPSTLAGAWRNEVLWESSAAPLSETPWEKDGNHEEKHGETMRNQHFHMEKYGKHEVSRVPLFPTF